MLKALLSNKFVRNVVLVAGGTAGAQVITLAFSPVITRLYGPEAFGLFGTFTAVLGVVLPIAALSYPIAIVLPKSDNEARGLAKLSVFTALIIALLLIILIMYAGDKIATLLHIEPLATLMALIPIAMLFNAFQQIMEQWLIRKKQFHVTARVAISQSFLLNTIKSAGGWINPTGVVLVLITAFGYLLYASQLWAASNKWSSKTDRINQGNAKAAIKSLAYKYHDFALYRTPQIAINAISQGMPILFLANSFGPSSAGYFTLGRAVLLAPAMLIGNSIGNVFYPQIAEVVNNRENPKKLLNKATLITFAVGLLPFLIIMIFGPYIFSLIFGDEWYIAGKYARWMALWLIFSLSARPLIATIPVIRAQRLFLVYEFIFVALKLGAILAGTLIYKDPLTTVAFYSITSAIFYCSLYFMLSNKMESYLKPAIS